MGESIENSLKDTLSLRASAHTGVAIRLQSLPLGEGGSRVSRKRETDEGIVSPFGRDARPGRRECVYPLSRLRRQLPQSGSQGETDCHTSVATLVRNDILT